VILAAIVLLSGCTAVHRQYKWEHASGACPTSTQFSQDTKACFDVGYIPGLYGGGNAIFKTVVEDCMKKRGYRQIGGTVKVEEPETWSPSPENRDIRTAHPELHDWPWPKNPPVGGWAVLNGHDYYDAACVVKQ
jgi:hypothetical protein